MPISNSLVFELILTIFQASDKIMLRFYSRQGRFGKNALGSYFQPAGHTYCIYHNLKILRLLFRKAIAGWHS